MLSSKNIYNSRLCGFGLNLAQRRKALRLTQAELAERLSLSPETVARFERGSYLPSLPLLFKLAQILSCDPTSLLAGELEVREPPPHQRLMSALEGLESSELDHIYNLVVLESQFLRKLRKLGQ